MTATRRRSSSAGDAGGGGGGGALGGGSNFRGALLIAAAVIVGVLLLGKGFESGVLSSDSDTPAEEEAAGDPRAKQGERRAQALAIAGGAGR